MNSFLSNPFKFIHNLQSKQKVINELIDTNRDIESRLSYAQRELLNDYLPPYFKKERVGSSFIFPLKNEKQIHLSLLYQLCRYTILQYLLKKITKLHMRNTINILLGVTNIYKTQTNESEKYDIEYSDLKNTKVKNVISFVEVPSNDGYPSDNIVSELRPDDVEKNYVNDHKEEFQYFAMQRRIEQQRDKLIVPVEKVVSKKAEIQQQVTNLVVSVDENEENQKSNSLLPSISFLKQKTDEEKAAKEAEEARKKAAKEAEEARKKAAKEAEEARKKAAKEARKKAAEEAAAAKEAASNKAAKEDSFTL
jgi:hypothetical protein